MRPVTFLLLFLLRSCGPDLEAVRPSWDGGARLSRSYASAGVAGLSLLSRGPATGIKVTYRRVKSPSGRNLRPFPRSLPLRPDFPSSPIRTLDTSDADGERNNSR